MVVFDTTRLRLRSAEGRKSLVYKRDAQEGSLGVLAFESPELETVVSWLKSRRGSRVWFLGGHVFKANVGWYVNKLRRWMTHLATNGAGLVHAMETRVLGHTSEDVPSALADGTYGMWRETSYINDLVKANSHLGVAEACCFGNSVHCAMGQDVFCMHPNYDGRAWGEASYVDFLKFVGAVERMQGGTLLVFGSAVCAPEVFLKAFGMARNAGAKLDDVAVAYFDCELRGGYFDRPAKTFQRTASQFAFVHGKHERTIPNLWRLMCAQ